MQYIPVVKILIRLDLESRQGGKRFAKVSLDGMDGHWDEIETLSFGNR